MGSIDRSRVDDLLEEACAHRLTVVAAGPGWGKTTAVSGWLARRSPDDVAVGWLTLTDDADNPAAFWDGVLAALRSSGAVPADHPLAALSADAGMSAEVLVALFNGLDSLTRPVLLVLDDFHVVEHPDVLDEVARMLEHLSALRLLLLTRIHPALPLGRLRLSGDLVEITAEDLAFDADEMDALARGAALSVDDRQVDALLARTQGWPAGLRLATLYLSREGAGRAVEAFTGTERTVVEYLVAEVLDRNTPAVRDLLLRTSVVDRVSADLVDALVPGAPGQKTLEMLEDRNEFVTSLGSDRTWFKYHPLLRELLEHTLRRDDPAAHRDAHRAAAAWLAQHGDPVTALGHAAQARDWDLFATIFAIAAAPALLGAGRASLTSWLHAVPYDSLPESVANRLLQAGLAFAEGALESTGLQLERARTQAVGAPVPAPTEALLALLTCAYLRRRGDSAAIIVAASQAVRAVDRGDPFPAGPAYRAVAATNLGASLLWTGDTAGARTQLESVLRASAPPGIELLGLSAQAHLALCDLVDGRLDDAERVAREALAGAAARGWTSMLQARPAHVATAWAALLRGDADAADYAVATGLAAVVGGAELPSTIALLTAQALGAASRGRPKAATLATERIRQAALGWDPPPCMSQALATALAEVALLTGDTAALVDRAAAQHDGSTWPAARALDARLLLAHGDLASARSVAASVTHGVEATSIFDLVAVVDAWLVQALVADRRQLPQEAVRACRHAVRSASGQRLVRPFLVTGSSRTAGLLQRLVHGQPNPDPFVMHLIDRLGASPPRAREPKPLIEPLTERELAVLAELSTMETNDEIAGAFYVSTNTIKTHLKALFRKLDVSSRREAVRRGRELGLLTGVRTQEGPFEA